MTGKVYLVGAGPGDPGLFTIKGMELLRSADVVMYDALANPELLKECKEGAELIDAGKRARDHHLSQWQTNELLVKYAQEGKTVVRLKGGDPFLFGRGAEEAEELRKAGAEVHVVPGVSSSISVPELAGIPVTHRDHTSLVTFITGHEKADRTEDRIDWKALVGGHRGRDVAGHAGRDHIQGLHARAESGRHHRIRSGVGHQGQRPRAPRHHGHRVRRQGPRHPGGPGMTVVGFTRPTQRIKDSMDEARAMGLDVMAAPSLEILPGDDEEFKRLEESVTEGCVVVFGSSTAVEQCQKFFGDRIGQVFQGAKIVSIGPATTKKLEAAGFSVDAVPEDYSSYGLVDLLKDEAAGRRVVIVRSDSGSDVLSDGLRAAGADLVSIASYKLKEVGMCPALLHLLLAVKRRQLDVMAFSSPMSASSFIRHVEEHFGKERGDEYLRQIKIAAIGKPTSERLESLGFKPDIVPEKTTFHDMLQAIKDAFPEQ